MKKIAEAGANILVWLSFLYLKSGTFLRNLIRFYNFLSIVSIVVLSIFLRQKGSPESKPVDASNAETED